MNGLLVRALRKAAKLPIQFYRRHKAKPDLARLEAHEDPRLKALGEAIREALGLNLGKEERRTISAIEDRRSFLLSSSAEIDVLDYGAGSPG